MLGQQYRDMIPAGIQRKVPIANKTGELDFVRNDAAIVDPFGDAPYVLVVLTRDDNRGRRTARSRSSRSASTKRLRAKPLGSFGSIVTVVILSPTLMASTTSCPSTT